MEQLPEGLIGPGVLIIKSVCSDYDYLTVTMVFICISFLGRQRHPILFSEIGFCMASCSYIYNIILYVCIYISVKVAVPWGSLTLLSY